MFKGAGSTFTVDGTTDTGSLNSATLAGPIDLGARSGGDLPWSGPICELVLYPAALTPAQIATNRSYLKTKWGTP